MVSVQQLQNTHFLSPMGAATNQKWTSWAWVLCLHMWKNFWNLHWWKKYFPCCFLPHDICYRKAPLCTASPLWKSLFHHSYGHQLPFTQPSFLTSQSFKSPGKWIFSLASSPSPLPFLVHASCSCTWKFWRASLYKKYSSKNKGRCFPGAYNKKKKILVPRRINSHFTYVPCSKHFLLTIRTGFTAKQQFTSLGFPSRFSAVLEGLIRSTKIHY